MEVVIPLDLMGPTLGLLRSGQRFVGQARRCRLCAALSLRGSTDGRPTWRYRCPGVVRRKAERGLGLCGVPLRLGTRVERPQLKRSESSL